MQWKVTYTIPGEQPDTEIFGNLSDAFAYSQPLQGEYDIDDWRYTRRQDLEARFNNGENSLFVAWSAQMPVTAYVVLSCV
jgi:hypothetical protein